MTAKIKPVIFGRTKLRNAHDLYYGYNKLDTIVEKLSLSILALAVVLPEVRLVMQSNLA